MNKWTTIAPQCSGEAESHRENLCVNLGTVGSGPRSLVWQRTRRGIANDTRDTWVLDSDDNIHDIKPSGRRFCPFAWPLWPLLGPSDTLQEGVLNLATSCSTYLREVIRCGHLHLVRVDLTLRRVPSLLTSRLKNAFNVLRERLRRALGIALHFARVTLEIFDGLPAILRPALQKFLPFT